MSEFDQSGEVPGNDDDDGICGIATSVSIEKALERCGDDDDAAGAVADAIRGADGLDEGEVAAHLSGDEQEETASTESGASEGESAESAPESAEQAVESGSDSPPTQGETVVDVVEEMTDGVDLDSESDEDESGDETEADVVSSVSDGSDEGASTDDTEPADE